jgi:hypothetical protein
MLVEIIDHLKSQARQQLLNANAADQPGNKVICNKHNSHKLNSSKHG